MPLIERFTPGGNIYPDGNSTFAVLVQFFRRWAENRDTMDAQIVTAATTEANAVATGAAEAVSAELAPYTLQPSGDSDVVFAVVDEDGRRTWLEVAADGGPTEHAKEKIGATGGGSSAGLPSMSTAITGLSFAVVDEDGARTWIEADEAGHPTPRAVRLMADGLGLVGMNVASGPAIASVGDSLTAGSGGTPYPTTLAGLTGRTVHNLGVGGETSATIAGRAGGRPWLATVANNTIPASGGVTVTIKGDDGSTVAPLLQHGSTGGRGLNPVQIAGVEGSLTLSSGVYTFTRATAGDAVPVPWPAPVSTEAMRNRRGDITVMWWGQNDGTNDATDIIGRERASIEALEALDKRWLVIGLPTGTAESRAPMELQFLREFGRRFINIRAYLSTTAALNASGIAPTQTDLDDLAVGRVPTSLRIDGTHLNTAGYNLVAQAVADRLAEMEWI